MTNTFFTWIKIVISAVCGIIAAFFDNYGIQQTYSQSAPEGYMLCFAHVRFRAKRGKFLTGN